MATLDRLAADQRAIIELVLQRGKSYDELGELLGIPVARVKELAREALTELAPSTAARVDPDWRGQLADYLLGQQSGPEATATRGHLKRSESARTWALSLLDSLDGLYPEGGAPSIPEADGAREGGLLGRARAEKEPKAERPAGPLSPAAQAAVRRRRLLAALAAVVVIVGGFFAIKGITGDDESKGGGGSKSQGQPAVLAQTVLRARSGERGAGVAVITERNGRRLLVVQASDLAPLAQGNGQREAYEVWLYNSRRDAVSVGAQYTDRQGNFQGAGALPQNFTKYKFIDVSREKIDQNTAHSGDSVLLGPLQSAPAQQGGGTPTQPGGTPTQP
jgi:anti-sigma-K factor RskA/sigma-70-like protein